MKTKIWIFLLSVSWIFRQNIGNEVWYEGKKHKITRAIGPEFWEIRQRNRVRRTVLKSKCKLVKSWANVTHSYRAGRDYNRSFN